MNDQEKKRWFSTGYLANGIGAVDAEKHVLSDAAIIRPGEARGHGMWIDAEMCASVVNHMTAAGDKGTKARFGHPDMCSDALGTFLGRWKGVSMGADGIARGTLFLSSTAAESPKGDLRNYIEQMAAKEPNHFGCSIVFSRDVEAEEAFYSANSKEIDELDASGQPTGQKAVRFISPDPANVQNLPHARCAAIHAADLVDDPAATDGMFSGVGGTELAARVSEWLDTHPEVLKAFSDNPDMLAITERYSAELRPFVERYTANHLSAPAEPEAPAKPEAQTPAEPDATLTAEVAKLKQLEADNSATIKQLTAEADKIRVELAAAISERDQLKADADKARLDAKQAQDKLAAMLQGTEPLTAQPGEGVEKRGSMWDDARKLKLKK